MKGEDNTWSDFFSRLPLYDDKFSKDSKSNFENIFIKKAEFINNNDSLAKWENEDVPKPIEHKVQQIKRVLKVQTRAGKKKQQIDEATEEVEKIVERKEKADEVIEEEVINVDGNDEVAKLNRTKLSRTETRRVAEAVVKENLGESEMESARRLHQRLHLTQAQLRNLFEITKKQAEGIVKSCTSCKEHPSSNAHLIAKTGFHKVNRPGIRWFIDNFKFSSSARQDWFMICVDQGSQRTHIKPLNNQKTGSILKALFELFLVYGTAPAFIACDSAAYFINDEFIKTLARYGTVVQPVPPYYKNGSKSERYVAVIKKYLRRSGRRDPTTAENLYRLHLETNILRETKEGESNKAPIDKELLYEVDKKRLAGLRLADFNEPGKMNVVDLNQIEEEVIDFNREIDESRRKIALKAKQTFKIGQKVKYKMEGKANCTPMTGILTDMDGITMIIRSQSGSYISRNLEDVYA